MKKISILLIIFLIILIFYPLTSEAIDNGYIKFTGKTLSCSVFLEKTNPKTVLSESVETMQSVSNYQLDISRTINFLDDTEIHMIKNEKEYSLLKEQEIKGKDTGAYITINSNGGKIYKLNNYKWVLNSNLTKNSSTKYLNEKIVDYQALSNYTYYKDLSIRPATKSEVGGNYDDILIVYGKTKLKTISYPTEVDKVYNHKFSMHVDKYTKQIKRILIYSDARNMNQEVSTFSNINNANSILSYKDLTKGKKIKEQSPTKNMDIVYFDVGHGDASLIITPNKEAILIDGGKTSTQSNKILSILKARKINKISSIIISHPHNDHIGGLVNIVNSFPVDSIYINDMAVGTTKTYQPNESYKQLKAIIERKKIKTIKVTQNSCLPYKDITGVFLAPKSNTKYSNLNNYSNVLLLKHQNMKFLFTGDIQKEAETNLINQYNSFKINVLKVAHHGSKTSSSPYFIKAIQPDYAIISTSSIKPTDFEKDDEIIGDSTSDIQTNNRLVKIFNTKRNGDITLISNGSKITTNLER